MKKRKSIKKVFRYPKKRYRRFKKGKQPISILTATPLLLKLGLEPIMGDPASGRWGAKKMYEQSGNITDAVLEGLEVAVTNFTGFKIKGPEAGKFFPQFPMMTYGMMILGGLGSKVATKLGANRQLAKVPMVGKYIKL